MLESSKYHDATYADGPDDITFEELQQALKTMAGTIVTPVDALVRFHHGTAHFPDDYEIDGVMVTALLKLSGASATDIRTLFRELAESPRDQDAPAADTTTTHAHIHRLTWEGGASCRACAVASLFPGVY